MGKVLEPGFQAWGMLYALQVPGMKTPKERLRTLKNQFYQREKNYLYLLLASLHLSVV